jgi:hypothetical protein
MLVEMLDAFGRIPIRHLRAMIGCLILLVALLVGAFVFLYASDPQDVGLLHFDGSGP